jgi:F0F1-type ATP synthase membrane subunit b/b'
MDTVNQIFAQLGANSSVFTQFVILSIFFLIMKFVVFDKLQYVLDNRVDKTENLESSAEEKFEQVKELSEKYNTHIEKAHVDAQDMLTKEKTQFETKKNEVYKEKENEMEIFIVKNREAIRSEIVAKRNEILKETNALAEEFIKKITN